MHSISDLTTFCRKTTGDIPPKLVGASTTVVGSRMYLFGGRLVTERRMVSDLYVFDMETFVWQKIIPSPEDGIPEARYFHSTEAWNNQLIVFGGMGSARNTSNPEDLCVLNDVRFYDLSTMHWLPPSTTNSASLGPNAEILVPKPRYAHLSSVTANRLFIIGGQDLSNVWLDDVYVYDLLGKTWIQRRNFPHHCGTYRSVAVSPTLHVRLPQEETRPADMNTILGLPGARFHDKPLPSAQCSTSTDEYPNDIYLYSNYNFTDVKREFEVFSPLPDAGFTITDRSTEMTGTSFPPGLRFPSGAVLGTHFIIAGTYLAHTCQSYSIWALDMLTMTWSRIDPGSAVATGSWFRACLWAEANKFMIFGNRSGNLIDDYNQRLLSWDHVAVIDLDVAPALPDTPLQLLADAPRRKPVARFAGDGRDDFYRNFFQSPQQFHQLGSYRPSPPSEHPHPPPARFWSILIPSRHHHREDKSLSLQDHPTRSFLGLRPHSNSPLQIPATTNPTTATSDGIKAPDVEEHTTDPLDFVHTPLITRNKIDGKGKQRSGPAENTQSLALDTPAPSAKLDSSLKSPVRSLGNHPTSTELSYRRRHATSPEVVEVPVARGFQRLVAWKRKHKTKNKPAVPLGSGLSIATTSSQAASTPMPHASGSSQDGPAQAATLSQPAGGSPLHIIETHDTSNDSDLDSDSSIQGSWNKFLVRLCFPRGRYHDDRR